MEAIALNPPEIKTTQRFSARAMGFLWSQRSEMDAAQVGYLDLIHKKKLKTLQGRYHCTYKRSNDYAGNNGYGRYYSTRFNPGLERLERNTRGTLAKDDYLDFDIKNCHFVLLDQLAKNKYGVDLLEVRKYCDNRDEYLAAVNEDREAAKTALLQVLYNGCNKYPFLLKMQAEIRHFAQDHLYADHAELLAWVRAKKEDNSFGSFLSYVLQGEESKVMLVMHHFFLKNGYSPDVPCYDGLMVRPLDESVSLKDALVACNALLPGMQTLIKDKLGYDVEIVHKPLSSLEVPTEGDFDATEIAPGVPYSEFLKAKTEFEKTCFYYEESDAVGRCDEDGNVAFFKIKGGHAARACNTQDFDDPKRPHRTLSFVDIWCSVRDRRTISRIDLKPSDDPRVFSPPLRFAYQKAEVDATEADCVTAWRNHTRIICGNDAAAIHYVERWFAHILQKPFDLPEVGLVITGSKGTGKDVYANFFMNFVLGESHCDTVTNPTHLFGDYAVSRFNKFLVRWSEASSVGEKEENLFKGMLTETISKFNPKGVPAYNAANYNRFIITTNYANPVRLTDRERRFLLLTCSPEKQQDSEGYFGPLCKLLERPAAGAAVAKYLLSIDLSDFNPRRMPISKYQASMVVADKSSEHLFLESDAWNGGAIRASELYELYETYCLEHRLPYCKTAASMGKKLGSFVRDGLLERDDRKTGTFYLKPAAGGAGA